MLPTAPKTTFSLCTFSLLLCSVNYAQRSRDSVLSTRDCLWMANFRHRFFVGVREVVGETSPAFRFAGRVDLNSRVF